MEVNITMKTRLYGPWKDHRFDSTLCPYYVGIRTNGFDLTTGLEMILHGVTGSLADIQHAYDMFYSQNNWLRRYKQLLKQVLGKLERSSAVWKSISSSQTFEHSSEIAHRPPNRI